MPANVVRTAEQERLWNKAKAQAEKQGRGGDYAYIMGIFKKMGGMEKSENPMGLLIGKELRPLADEDLQKTTGELAEQVGQGDEKLERSFADEQWSMKFSGYRDLYIQALEVVKARMQLAEDEANARKGRKPWREVEEMPKSERDAYRKELDKQSQKFNERYDKIGATTADLDKQYIERRIAEAKAMTKSLSEGADLDELLEKHMATVDINELPKVTGLEGLDEYLQKGQVIEIGKKGGKIVGRDSKGKPIYEHQGEGMQGKPSLPAETKEATAAEKPSLETAVKLLDVAIQKQSLKHARMATDALVEMAKTKGNKGKVMSELRSQLASARKVAKTMVGRAEADRRKPPKGREPWDVGHVTTARMIRDTIDNARAKVASQGKSEATKQKQAMRSISSSVKYRMSKLADAKLREEKYPRGLLGISGVMEQVRLHKEIAELYDEAGDKGKVAEHKQLEQKARERLDLMQKPKAEAPKTEEVKTEPEQLKLFGKSIGLEALDEYLAKADGCPGSKIRSEGKGRGEGRGQGKGPMGSPVFGKADDGKPGKSLGETSTEELRATLAKLKPTDPGAQKRIAALKAELKKRGGDNGKELTMNKANFPMKNENEKDKKDMENEANGADEKAMKKSEGLDAMDAYLAKAVGSDESGGKAPSQSMPTGNPPGSMPTSSSVETNTAQEGGPVEGIGTPGKSRPQPPSHQAQIGKVDSARTDVLSADDATVAKYVESGYMGEGMKKSDMTQRHQFTQQELDRSVAQRRAAAEARLRKGEEDMTIHPYAQRSFEGTDKRVEELAKSEFYQGTSPTMAPPTAVIGQAVLCKSCGAKHSAMLTSCPMCGDNCTAPGIYNGRSGSVILEKSIQTPGLQRKREEDLKIG